MNRGPFGSYGLQPSSRRKPGSRRGISKGNVRILDRPTSSRRTPGSRADLTKGDLQILRCAQDDGGAIHRIRPLILLLTFTLVTGCGEEDRTPFDYTPSVDRVATSGDDSTDVAAPVSTTLRAPPPAPPLVAMLTATLAPAGLTSPTGEAALDGSGSRASVTARLSGGTAGVSYDGTIRQGLCEAVGSRVAALVPITADSAGVGASFSRVSVQIGDLLQQPHVVTFGRGGSAEACGSLGTGTPPDRLPPDP